MNRRCPEIVDPLRLGEPVALDRSGRALFAPRPIEKDQYRVSARSVPAKGSPFPASSSQEFGHPDPSHIDIYQTKRDRTVPGKASKT